MSLNFRNLTQGNVNNIWVIGKEGSGKTTMCGKIAMWLQKPENMTVISPKEATEGFYRSHFPKAKIHAAYDDEIIARLMERDANDTHEVEVVIFDNCITDWDSKTLRYFLFTSSHYRTICIVSTDRIINKRSVTKKFSYIFTFENPPPLTLTKLHRNYLSNICNINKLKDTLRQNCKGFDALVISNDKSSDDRFYVANANEFVDQKKSTEQNKSTEPNLQNIGWGSYLYSFIPYFGSTAPTKIEKIGTTNE